jgi:hypothetical protein
MRQKGRGSKDDGYHGDPKRSSSNSAGYSGERMEGAYELGGSMLGYK